MAAPGSSEDVLQDASQGRAVDVGMRVVGADDLGSSFDGCPLPARPSDNRAAGIGTQIAQLAGTTGGDESDDLYTGQRVL